MLYAPPPILTARRLRHTRLMPANGTVLVYVGQNVHAADVIAETHIPQRHVVIDVRQALGGTRDEAERMLLRTQGERITKGEIIAETRGPLSRLLRSPLDGRIEMSSGGKLVISSDPQPWQLVAGYPGKVAEVHGDRGVTIETEGSWIRGEWGNGLNAEGQLAVFPQGPDAEVSSEVIEPDMRGKILIGGWLRGADALRKAVDTRLSGLAIGSISSDLLVQAAALPFPLIVLEGFGRIPVNALTWLLADEARGRLACLHADFNPPLGIKPEMILPRSVQEDVPAPILFHAPQQYVRIQGDPYAGRIGRIQRIHPGLSQLPSGLRAPAADVFIEPDANVLIPLSNLELLD